MTKVNEGVYFIQGQDEFIPDSHVYVIGDPASNDLSLIDVGLTGKGNYKVQSIKGLGIELEAVKRVIMTHTHLDHIGCLSEIRKAIPSVELWVHKLEAELLEKGDDRGVYGMNEFKSMCQMQYGLKSDAFKLKVDKKLEGGESLHIGGMKWEVIHIPGHSMGGIALYHSSLKILIPGDVVYADYAIGRFDLYGANADALKKSLYHLADLEIDMLLPGHNQIVKSLPSDYIRKTAKMWEPYLV
ncbi:MAG TPA: MBL fold metallo-hydrolase [Syntrophorhabdus sp.]|jgi:glyoxylase-like metal-dependent hydrolase (beta-lactamase superfamily II)|nr:MBL fold metallo-hydrolase [Syntrophorhabdus sp.]HPW37160.1 MBL fold metallo-hydrolase [Syntrophorhabdus sp.]HQB35260.1 MBL fold metallo-hydrolase [Syntrophorhabdus sp.]HQO64282.1 MBL fold metallo-hydrolase [Syntrophorhabdus sp.]